MINNWLATFKKGWTTKNIDLVLDLFAEDIRYWETPYQQLPDKAALRKEWEAARKQNNILLDLQLFASSGNKHTILWQLSYQNEKLELQNWAGTYLIELDAVGKCIYFHQTGEPRPGCTAP